MNDPPDRKDRTDNVITLPGLRPPRDEEPVPDPAPSTGRDKESDPDGRADIRALERPPPGTAEMAPAVEAVLFSSGEPVSMSHLCEVLAHPSAEEVEAALALLRTRYERNRHGIRLVEVADGWQLRTHPRYAPWVVRARGARPVRLSQAALETLAIVAYKQPVTRAEVEEIRGVACGGVLRMLGGRGLVKSLGHRDEPGRPLEYGTTPRFLETFGLRDLSDLPTLRDLRELQEDDATEGARTGAPDAADETPADREPEPEPAALFRIPTACASPEEE